MTYIYTLSDENNKIRYVGKSNNPSLRLKEHLKESKKKKSYKDKWLQSLIGPPKLLILDEVLEKDWVFWEIYWIEQLRQWGFDLVNGTDGGEGSNGFKGKKHSEETKLKCTEAVKRRKKNSSLKGETNGRSKLIEEDVKKIKEMLNQGYSQYKLAKMFKVSRPVIGSIKKGKLWGHVLLD